MKKHNKIIDKETMYDILVGLTEMGADYIKIEKGIIIALIYDADFVQWNTYKIAAFKDPSPINCRIRVHWVEEDSNDCDHTFDSINDLIKWMFL